MVNYNDGKIYKIICNITDECYIGSTCEPTLARRLATHVNAFKGWKEGKRTKTSSYDIIDRGDYQILLIESFPCNSKDELTSREGQIIRQFKLDCGCVNKRIDGRTIKEWQDDNKDKIKEYRELNRDKQKDYMKEYNESNKDKIKEKSKENITCICGSCIRKGKKARHERTIKHQDYIKSIQ